MPFRHALLTILLFSLSVSFATAQTIRVELPDLTGLSPGSPVEIPVELESPVQESDEVISIEITVEFDDTVITLNGIDRTGTLTENWTIERINASSELIDVAIAHTVPLTASSGTLLFLNGTVASGVGSSPLSITRFAFGDLNAVTATSGNVSAGNDLVFTEVHADPDDSDGDANNDGIVDDGDEFVEIVNTGSTAIDLEGYQLVDGSGTPLFTFPAASLEPGVAAVVFGGGTPVNIPGLVFTSGDLDLADDGLTVALLDDSDTRIDAVTYGPEADNEQSVTRSPDFTDAFILHTQAPSGALYSPGEDPNGDPLPVEFGSFDAVRDGRDVVLRWTTLVETNNSGFGVEQEIDDRFTEVRFVPGAGTTTERQVYAVRLRNLEAGTHRFRLRQVDVNGTNAYSDVRSVAIPLETSAAVELAGPNPFRSATALELRVRETQPVTAALYNVLGQRVRVLYEGTAPAGERIRIQVRGADLPSGLYFYRVTGAGVRLSGQLVHVR
jgi:hypothetical protein